MRRTGSIVAFLLLLLIIPAGCSSSRQTPNAGAPTMRVRLLANQEQILVTATSNPRVRPVSDAKPRSLQFPLGQAVQIMLGADGWRVGNIPLGSGELLVEQDGDGTFAVNGKNYRGRFRFVPISPGRFDVMNDVDVDSYLKGVLAAEMLARWDLEAYKAQAIIARTYALYQANTVGINRPFDVEDTTADQVYGGITSESEKARDAADATSGIVLTAGPGNGKIFKAYFSACCGGISQSSYDAFGEPYNEALAERNNGALCNQSPRFNWGPIEIRKDELTRRIKTWGAAKSNGVAAMAQLERIDIQYVNKYGRPVRFLITDVNGQRYTLGSEETRHACNWEAGNAPKLFSSFFKPIATPETIQFVEGHGHGHGVGMCQWCAQTMAERGYNAEYIIQQSYPRAQLKRAY
jgi:stage II sporulation protein D